MAEPRPKRPRKTQPDPDFQKAVIAALRKFMEGDNPNHLEYNGTELAELLGVDAGAVSRYLNGGMQVGAEPLVRALLFGMVVHYRGKHISARTEADQVRILFDKHAEIDPDNVEGLAVKIPRIQPQREHATIHVKVVG